MTGFGSKAPAGAPRERGDGTKGAERSLLIDIVKGLAITLVAVGHTNEGISRRGMWASDFGVRLDHYIYAFHMPAFFFVSGVFLYASLEKRGLGHFLRNKVGTILYPFWMWGLVLPLLPLVFGRYMASHAPGWKDYLLNLVTGSFEWFLPTLFVVTIIAALLRRVPTWMALAAALLLQHFCQWPASVPCLSRTWAELPFLLAGALVGKNVGRLEHLPRTAAVGLAALCGLAVYLLAPIYIGPMYIRFFPTGIVGTAMLFLVARAVGGNWLGRGFAWIGVASLGVFLLSAFGQGLGRALLFAAHVRQPVAHLLVSSLLATLPAAWIYQHRVRLHVGWMFIAPWTNK